MVEGKDGRQEPATEVRWTGDFENKFVKWQAPVLTAKEAGGRPMAPRRRGRTHRAAAHHDLRAGGGQGLAAAAAENPDAPTEVVILSDQGPAVQFPVGAEFDDFRVEARYRDGFTRLVTKQAMLTTPEPPPAPR